MVTLARTMVKAEIIKLMRSLSENLPKSRTLKLSKKVDIYSDSRTPYGQIIGITLPPISEVPMLKVGIYNPFNREQKHIYKYTLFSMGNFNEETLKWYSIMQENLWPQLKNKLLWRFCIYANKALILQSIKN